MASVIRQAYRPAGQGSERAWPLDDGGGLYLADRQDRRQVLGLQVDTRQKAHRAGPRSLSGRQPGRSARKGRRLPQAACRRSRTRSQSAARRRRRPSGRRSSTSSTSNAWPRGATPSTAINGGRRSARPTARRSSTSASMRSARPRCSPCSSRSGRSKAATASRLRGRLERDPRLLRGAGLAPGGQEPGAMARRPRCDPAAKSQIDPWPPSSIALHRHARADGTAQASGGGGGAGA